MKSTFCQLLGLFLFQTKSSSKYEIVGIVIMTIEFFFSLAFRAVELNSIFFSQAHIIIKCGSSNRHSFIRMRRLPAAFVLQITRCITLSQRFSNFQSDACVKAAVKEMETRLIIILFSLVVSNQ